MEEEIIVSKVKFRMDNSDGTYQESNIVMPNKIAEIIHATLFKWKKDWVTTTSTVEKYQKAEKKFLSKKPPK